VAAASQIQEGTSPSRSFLQTKKLSVLSESKKLLKKGMTLGYDEGMTRV